MRIAWTAFLKDSETLEINRHDMVRVNGDGTYTVDVRGYDMNGYEIRTSYTGNIEMKV